MVHSDSARFAECSYRVAAYLATESYHVQDDEMTSICSSSSGHYLIGSLASSHDVNYR
jgi:hypothetical protein